MRVLVALIASICIVSFVSADTRFGTSKKIEMRKNGSPSASANAATEDLDSRAKVKLDSTNSLSADSTQTRARIDTKALADSNVEGPNSAGMNEKPSEDSNNKFGTNKKLERRLNAH